MRYLDTPTLQLVIILFVFSVIKIFPTSFRRVDLQLTCPVANGEVSNNDVSTTKTKVMPSVLSNGSRAQSGKYLSAKT